jgi:hypothetical protein
MNEALNKYPRPLIVSGVPFAFAEWYCGQKASR